MEIWVGYKVYTLLSCVRGRNMKKILMLLGVLLITSTLAGCENAENSTKNNQEQVQQGKIIADNKFIKATYSGITESFGQTVLVVKLENKTDKEITVVPRDSSVDDTMVLFGSAIPVTMLLGKLFNQGWLIGNFPKKNIEFKISILDENWKEIFITDVIRIEK